MMIMILKHKCRNVNGWNLGYHDTVCKGEKNEKKQITRIKKKTFEIMSVKIFMFFVF
jgi:hypothetical protein